MDLNFAPATTELVEKTRAFVREVVLPVEERHHGVAPDGEDWRRELQDAAKAHGVFGPHLPAEYGGHGLGMVERAPVFEEAGYSLFGPIAVNCAAPDEGNQHLLDRVATPEQRKAYLDPLARGEVRSAFAMTEPAPGAGSDPRALATTATRVEAGWRIDGLKRFITGADGAAFSIVMARTSGEPGARGGATMFLVDADNPGMILERHVPTMDKSMAGGHCEVRFENCVVSEDAVLGELDRGFEYAQVRLGPARMTHCMRWLGAARHAHELALGRAVDREAFGERLSNLGLTQQLIADSEIDLAASRALILRACWELDHGESAGDSTAIAKTFVSEAVGRIVDRAVQVHGGLGVSEDLPLARIYREVRPFRIYDGPSEVHRWALAKRAARRARDGFAR
ncbi:acyl-CoA dehydrogenase family protein [Amycolatopsis sp. FDAARGOS 1241]|uniref:acyl-CoA dehydrogenase family protein n=1 Tax=Amycolatopsis sp. FDAARGOS 1241 TaxID=2778070 RepID=UPI00194DDC67|nr:acyl-CoA dehydrogenase family protein [Amycolatopsis sp. FDAARGOS 1241]QRP43192.1 acyl-CoA dehydrogenase family protein [Amycolatopsis sp. FDAARGOS 1241]